MKCILNFAVLVIAAVTLTFGLQSCNSVKSIDKTQLEGYWTLKTMKGEDAKAGFPTTLPYVQFDIANNVISGNGSCNSFTGAYTLTDANVFSAPNLAATMKMCIQNTLESQFFATLSTPQLVLSVDKDGLLTFTQDKDVVLQFAKGEAPKETAKALLSADALAGAWTLTSLAGEDIAALFTGKTPTMEFAADGKVFGNGGCNTYRSAYTLQDNTITFAPVASTKMACPSLKGEGLFTGLLADPLQASLDGDKLTFSKNGNVVLEFTKGAAK